MTPAEYQKQWDDIDLEWFKLLHRIFTKEEIGNIRRSLYKNQVLPNTTHEKQIRLSHSGDLIWNLAKLVYHEKVEALEALKKPSKHFRRSLEYRTWVGAVKYRDGLKCRRCGSKRNLEAHHIKSVSKHPEVSTNLNNGITLCNACHKWIHALSEDNAIKFIGACSL